MYMCVCVCECVCVRVCVCVCEYVHACTRGPVSTSPFLPISEVHETQYDIHHRHRHHHHVAIMALGRLLTYSGLMHPEVSSTVLSDSFCLMVRHYDTFITFHM